jgi:hypothetical protein
MLKDIKVKYNSRLKSVSFTKESSITDEELETCMGYLYWRFRKEANDSEFSDDGKRLILKM